MKKIQILGTGCPKCKALPQNAEIAAKELGIEHQIEKVTDITEIMKFGVMMTPALARRRPGQNRRQSPFARRNQKYSKINFYWR